MLPRRGLSGLSVGLYALSIGTEIIDLGSYNRELREQGGVLAEGQRAPPDQLGYLGSAVDTP